MRLTPSSYVLAALLLGSLAACDVRRNDQVMDDKAVEAQILRNDSTTVRLIDSVYNFGQVQEGEKVEFHFRFVNAGDKPMVITKASASCGCTVPEKPERPIMPGDTGYIKASFDSQGRVGLNEKTITVEANVKPVFPTLLLTGNVMAYT